MMGRRGANCAKLKMLGALRFHHKLKCWLAARLPKALSIFGMPHAVHSRPTTVGSIPTLSGYRIILDCAQLLGSLFTGDEFVGCTSYIVRKGAQVGEVYPATSLKLAQEMFQIECSLIGTLIPVMGSFGCMHGC